MPGYLPQLTRPVSSGDSQSQSRHQSMAQSSSSSQTRLQSSHGDNLQPQRSMVNMSSLVEWQVSTAAGLRDKEEKLRMTTSLADRQKVKIEELRKSNEVLGTDLARSKEENQSLSDSLVSTKEEVEVMAKQVKIVSAQIKRIRGEREELGSVNQEKGHDLLSLTESFNQLYLAQVSKEKGWNDEIMKAEEDIGQRRARVEDGEGAGADELRALQEKLRRLDDEKLQTEELIEEGVKENNDLEEKLKMVEDETALTLMHTREVVEDGQKKEECLKKDILKLKKEEQELKMKAEDLSGLMNLEKKRNEEAETLIMTVEKDIAELGIQTVGMAVDIKELDERKQQFEAQLVENNELVEALERKLLVVEEMKVEIGSLDKTLKESEGKRLKAEEDYKILGEVQYEKDILEAENQKLSQDVHENEFKVQNRKVKVAAAQEDLKLKSKNLCLLESRLLEVNAGHRNKVKQVEKVRKLAESRGKSSTGSKSSSSGLKNKFDSLKAELDQEKINVDFKKENVLKLEEALAVEVLALKSAHEKLGEVISTNKDLDYNLTQAKSALVAVTGKGEKLEARNKEAEEENQVLAANVKVVEEKVHALNSDLKLLVAEVAGIEDGKVQSESKFNELKEMNEQIKLEIEKIKKGALKAEEALKLSVDKMESSENIKNAIKEKTGEIKKLEKEVKNAKKNQVTAAKRKEKVAKQLEKNKGVSEALAVDIGVIEEKILKAQETMAKLKEEIKGKHVENDTNFEAAEANKSALADIAAEITKKRAEVKNVQKEFELMSKEKSKLVSEVARSAQEYQGLLSCKDREFSDVRTKLTEEVAELAKKLDSKSRDLEVRETEAKNSSEGSDDVSSQEKALLDITKQTEAAEDERSKVQRKLVEKTAEVTKLKEKLSSLKSRNGVPPTSIQRSRTPLGSIRPVTNFSVSTSRQGKSTPSSSQPSSSMTKPATTPLTKATAATVRQARTLLPPGRQTVPQSPVRSFLAPPPRNTPSSHHSRPKKKGVAKPPSTPRSVPQTQPPIVNFDLVMGLSDDMDSSE